MNENCATRDCPLANCRKIVIGETYPPGLYWSKTSGGFEVQNETNDLAFYRLLSDCTTTIKNTNSTVTRIQDDSEIWYTPMSPTGDEGVDLEEGMYLQAGDVVYIRNVCNLVLEDPETRELRVYNIKRHSMTKLVEPGIVSEYNYARGWVLAND